MGHYQNVWESVKGFRQSTIPLDKGDSGLMEEETKYVKLSQVEELITLYDARASFYDWSDQYEKYTRKIETTIEFLRRNAKGVW